MMYRYNVSCSKCKHAYVTECEADDFDKLKCPECKSAKQGWKSMKTINKNPHKIYGRSTYIGGITSSKLENFGYRANINMEKAKGERRAAEALSNDPTPYAPEYYDTSNLDEGIHDNEDGIVL